MSLQRLWAFLAVALLGAAAGLVAPGPAAAAGGYCAKGSGVTVVVDNGPLGGGSSVGCDPNGANTAGSTVVPRAGYSLTYVQRQPGFVCKVAGAPASATCGNTPPADAYWGLFWSDGRSGTWSYSSVGIGSLEVPAGGFIGWRFQGSDARTDPGPAPVSPGGSGGGSSPKPTAKPSPGRTATSGPTGAGTDAGTGAGPTATGSPTRGSGATSPGSTPSEAAAARVRAKKAAAAKARATKSATASPTATSSASATPTTGTTERATGTASADTNLSSGEKATGSGPALPLFAGGLLAVLLATAGTLAWRRRRS